MIEAVRHPANATSALRVSAGERITLCEALDRVLNKGAVLVGEATISVADVDLIYLGLQVVLTSIETARRSVSDARGASVVESPEIAPHTPSARERPGSPGALLGSPTRSERRR